MDIGGCVLIEEVLFFYSHYLLVSGFSLPLITYDMCLCFSFLLIGLTSHSHHNLQHSRFLFARVHKAHHRFRAPIGFAAEYAHPVEFLVGNILPVFIGPVVCGAMCILWICVSELVLSNWFVSVWRDVCCAAMCDAYGISSSQKPCRYAD